MVHKKTSKSTGKIVKHINKKRLLKSFGLLLGLMLIIALGLFLIQQYNSTYPAESIAGKAYSDLTAEQKQGYWACYNKVVSTIPQRSQRFLCTSEIVVSLCV